MNTLKLLHCAIVVLMQENITNFVTWQCLLLPQLNYITQVVLNDVLQPGSEYGHNNIQVYKQVVIFGEPVYASIALVLYTYIHALHVVNNLCNL